MDRIINIDLAWTNLIALLENTYGREKADTCLDNYPNQIFSAERSYRVLGQPMTHWARSQIDLSTSQVIGISIPDFELKSAKTSSRQANASAITPFSKALAAASSSNSSSL